MIIPNNYSLLIRFIETYLSSGYKNINASDPIIREVEEMMKINDQFFYIGDLIIFRILFISGRVTEKIGVKPELIDPGFFITTTHPDDLRRHHYARARLITLGQEFFVNRDGKGLMSFDVRTKKPGGGYYHMLYQWYFFYSWVPHETVYLMVVFTDISKFEMNKTGTHHYCGNDLSFFRYPDMELLSIGNIYSNHELEVLKLIEMGLSSEQIALKLYRSIHTIETHRHNIIRKSGKSSLLEVIHDLKMKGLL
jgi:hypothetical protein